MFEIRCSKCGAIFEFKDTVITTGPSELSNEDIKLSVFPSGYGGEVTMVLTCKCGNEATLSD